MSRIIITDDSITARLTIQKLIQEYFAAAGREAPEFLQAASGEEVLGQLSGTTDLLLITLDVNMPGKDGLTLAEEIQKSRPGIPILVISTNVQKSIQDRAGSMGLHFLEKPVNLEKMKASLAKLGL